MTKQRLSVLLTAFLCAIACASVGFAEENEGGAPLEDANVPESVQTEAPAVNLEPRWGLRLGRGMSFEKTNSTKADVSRMSILVGADVEWALTSMTLGLGVEYGRFGSSDGNQTIQVSNLNESLLAWTDLGFAREGYFVPYVGGGVGVSRLTAETQLSGLSEKSTGLWLPVAGARVGVLATWNSILRLRAEARYEMAQGLKTNDAHLGVALNLQYLFGRLN